MKVLGKEVSCPKIGNTPYREGIFSTWNDPAKYGLFYHAALITRRGDVSKAKRQYTIAQKDHAVWNIPFEDCSAEISGVSVSFDAPPEGASLLEAPFALDHGRAVSDTGELMRDGEHRYGIIDTPLTKCTYGYLGENGVISLDGLTISCKTEFAVIAVSALDGLPIGRSKNMLMTTVGHAVNTGAVFEGEKMIQLGTPPVLIENIEATVEIETHEENLRVWAVGAEGVYIGNPAVEYASGKLTIHTGEKSRSMYYLIQAE
jgi:hypothetical protein